MPLNNSLKVDKDTQNPKWQKQPYKEEAIETVKFFATPFHYLKRFHLDKGEFFFLSNNGDKRYPHEEGSLTKTPWNNETYHHVKDAFGGESFWFFDEEFECLVRKKKNPVQ